MEKPRLLDLFCKAGGATKGYQEAGFYVVGIDIEPQPNYVGDEFIQADIHNVAYHGRDGWIIDDVFRCRLGHFDAVHASPPCQAYTILQKQHKRQYPDLIPMTRRRLREGGMPYVIENVPRAPLEAPTMLCGTMFDGLRVIRHRLFETNFDLTAPPHGKHPLVFTHDKRKKHYGKLDQNTSYVQVTGGGNCTMANACDAMGIDWMTKEEINEAIPPAYARWIGECLLQSSEIVI